MKNLFSFLLIVLCLHGNAQTFTASGGSIPDASPAVNFTIPVTGLSSNALNHSFGLTQICININHTYDSDLEARLIAPDGTVISLFTNIGGNGHNFLHTCFDSLASAPPISSGIAPFSGVFLPEGNIGNVNNGQNGNGVWTLQVQDDAAVDTGSVVNWSISFGPSAPVPFILTSDIPLVILNTNGQSIPNGSKIFAKMKVVDNGTGAINHSSDPGNVYSGNIGITIRGAYSASLPQKPYGLTTLTADSTADSNVVMLNMPSEHDWILLAGYNDKSFIRNTLMYKLFNDMGHYASRYRHCEVILNGEYQGIYIFLEKIKRDNNRVNISKLQTSDISGNALTGGYIFTHDYPDAGWTSVYSPPACNDRYYDYEYNYPSANNIQPQQADYIHHIVDTLENRIYSPLFADPVWGYRPKINSNSFVDYLLCSEMSWNNDGYKKSMYFHKNKDSHDPTVHAGPIWDFDWALKRMPWTPTDYSGWKYEQSPCEGDVLYLPWWNIMMGDTVFQNEVKCHWEYYRQHTFHTDSINRYIDSMAILLHQAQERHFIRWPILGINTGTPESPPFSATYQEEIDTLKSILQQRMRWMDLNLPGNCNHSYVPVPVSFSSIKAWKQQHSGIVQWKIESELNITGYELQKSSDGIHFTDMQYFLPAGNGLSKTYQWTDNNLLNGNNYYRVLSKDQMGISGYSPIVKIWNADDQLSVFIFPNPTNGASINIQIGQLTPGLFTVKCFNAPGQEVESMQIFHPGGKVVYTFRPAKPLAKGVYQFEITSHEGLRQIIKLLVEQ